MSFKAPIAMAALLEMGKLDPWEWSKGKKPSSPHVLRNLVMMVRKDEVDRKGLFKNKTNKLVIHLLVFWDC